MLAKHKLNHTPGATVKMSLDTAFIRPPVEVDPMTWFPWRQRCQKQSVFLTFKLHTRMLPSSIESTQRSSFKPAAGVSLPFASATSTIRMKYAGNGEARVRVESVVMS
jgi:hypothetical protein